MKKYVIAAGVPRAGKSTLCRMLAGELGYQHIGMDAVLAGIETVFPESGICTGAELPVPEKFRRISAKLAPFLRAMMDSGEYGECDYGAVFDVCQLLPEDCARYPDTEDCRIVYPLTSDVSPEERFAILRSGQNAKNTGCPSARPPGTVRTFCGRLFPALPKRNKRKEHPL